MQKTVIKFQIFSNKILSLMLDIFILVDYLLLSARIYI